MLWLGAGVAEAGPESCPKGSLNVEVWPAPLPLVPKPDVQSSPVAGLLAALLSPPAKASHSSWPAAHARSAIKPHLPGTQDVGRNACQTGKAPLPCQSCCRLQAESGTPSEGAATLMVSCQTSAAVMGARKRAPVGKGDESRLLQQVCSSSFLLMRWLG